VDENRDTYMTDPIKETYVEIKDAALEANKNNPL
jgi:hypothetical protein